MDGEELNLDILKTLTKPSNTKIVLLVLDGLGGIPDEENGLTELEAAYTPNLDKLAYQGICGLQQPVASGITPGSGPGHLSLFGYNPFEYQVGRGVLAAYGIGFELLDGDVAARGNFCTIDENNIILDRRAGRIPTEENKKLCRILQENIDIEGVEVFVETVKEHRLLLVLRGEGLSGDLHDTDPQETGKPPLPPQATSPRGEKTKGIIEEFLRQARNILKDHHPANMILLRGFSQKPKWPSIQETYKLRGAAIAVYPMYRGLAKLLGMDILDTGETISEEFQTLEEHWERFDFFYIHIKKTDSSGEDGDFDRKKSIIEEVDQEIPRLLELKPDVIIVTGDHSTPSMLKAHSWHPVPLLLWSKNVCRDNVKHFGERECINGSLGPRFPGVEIMPLALAHAGRLEKFGA